MTATIMLNSQPCSTDLEGLPWNESDLAQAERLWQPPRLEGKAKASIGDNDPLSGLTQWQLYNDAIWVSDEDTYTKIMLLCIARFMDKNLRGSSMSYSQIATACGFGERKAKSAAKAARDRWLRIEVGKGRYWPGKGNENLYSGIIPGECLAELRRRKAKGHAVSVDEGVAAIAERIVDGMTGVSVVHNRGV